MAFISMFFIMIVFGLTIVGAVLLLTGGIFLICHFARKEKRGKKLLVAAFILLVAGGLFLLPLLGILALNIMR